MLGCDVSLEILYFLLEMRENEIGSYEANNILEWFS